MPREWDWDSIRNIGIGVLVIAVIVVVGTVISNRVEAAKPHVTQVFGTTLFTVPEDAVDSCELARWPDGQLFIPVATQGAPNPAHPVLVATTKGEVMAVDIEYWRSGETPRLWKINGHYAIEAPFGP